MQTPAVRRPTDGPAFLRGLDHVLACECCDGWLAQCPVFGCPELLHITPGVGEHWRFECAFYVDRVGHTHDEVASYLDASLALDENALRKLWRAIMLSPRLEVCEALLRGQDVPRSALDPLWVRRFGV